MPEPGREGIARPLIRSICGRVAIRVVRGSDAAACTAFFRHLEPRDVRLRFGSASVPDLPFLVGECRGVSFAALDPVQQILGVADIGFLGVGSAELGIVVASDVQRCGIGRMLVAHAIGWARAYGLSQVIGNVLAENRAMLSLAFMMGFESVGRDGFFCALRRTLADGPAA